MPALLQQLNSDISTVVARARHGLAKVNSGRKGAGTGTILHPDGLILTNAHVVQRGSIEVILSDGYKRTAQLLAYDPELDLAALSVEAHALPTIALGDSTTLQPGQLVFALGHPWGVPGAVSAGPVINVGPPPELSPYSREFIQAGLQLRPGHSGGPMIDARGRLVGLNTMITGPEVGLAVPVHVIKGFLRQHLGSKPTQGVTYL